MHGDEDRRVRSSRRPASWPSAAVAGVGVAAGAGEAAGGREARVRLNETLPVHSKWWRDAPKTEGELLYVALGDSAAQGIGASAPKNSYVGVIADHLRAVTGRIGARRQPERLRRDGRARGRRPAAPLRRRYTPDLVTVAIGANDIAAFDPERVPSGASATVFAALPGPRDRRRPSLLLPALEREEGRRRQPHPAGGGGGARAHVVPLHETMKRQGLRGIFTQFAEDLFHPNDHGYRVWASAFLPAVTRAGARAVPATRRGRRGGGAQRLSRARREVREHAPPRGHHDQVAHARAPSPPAHPAGAAGTRRRARCRRAGRPGPLTISVFAATSARSKPHGRAV